MNVIVVRVCTRSAERSNLTNYLEALHKLLIYISFCLLSSMSMSWSLLLYFIKEQRWRIEHSTRDVCLKCFIDTVRFLLIGKKLSIVNEFVPHLILECVCVWSVDRSMKPSPSSYAKCTIFTPFSAHTKPICLDQFIFSLFDSRTQFTCFVFLFWSSTDSMSFQSRQ